MIGFLIMSFIWFALPITGNFLTNDAEFIANNPFVGEPITDTIRAIFQSAPEGWGTTLVNVLWGAWFGRVLLETGVAATLVKKTVELGGDRPIITVSLLNLVVAIIFTSMTGAGPVIAIGVIVLPILLALGIPKAIALFSFMGAVGAGIFLNPVNFAQFQLFYFTAGEEITYHFSDYVLWGVIALGVMLVVTTISTAIALGKQKAGRAWAAQTGRATDNNYVPGIALITPVFPVVGVIFLDIPVIFGFILAGFFALFVCGKMKKFEEVCRLVNKMFCDGVIDTAPLVGFLLTLPMFNKAAEYAAPYFQVVIGDIIPTSPLFLCIIFAVLSVFGLFRGPLTLVGSGAATLGVIRHMFPVTLLYPLFAIGTVTMNIGSCITQSWVAWGLGYTKVEGKEFLKLSIPNGVIISFILAAITYFMFGVGI